jgi:hypothetical protein
VPKCTCGKSFHACSSCGLSNTWEYEYCCREHWEQSQDYKRWKGKFKALYKTINSVQQMFLMELLTEIDSDYENEFYDWVREISENKEPTNAS